MSLMSPPVILGMLVTGCSYSSGSFADRGGLFPGPQVTLPCLDLAVALVHSPSATGPVIQYSFGNRCRRSVTVDIGAARVTARDASGTQVDLRPYDPRAEIRPLPLEGLMSGREQILYRSSAPMSAISICIDVAAIDASARATTPPICLAEAATEVQL